jgi:hypothetical protein
MSSASWALQQALYTALEAHAPLRTRVSGIYDAPPQDAAMPYVTIGEDVMSDASGKAMRSSDHRLALHIWSRSAGKKEAKQLLALVDEALEQQPLLPAGFALINMRFLQSTVLTDADGLTQHGIAEYRGRMCPL